VRPLKIDAKNGTVVEEQRKNEAKSTCRYLNRKSTGTRCRRRGDRFRYAVFQFILSRHFPNSAESLPLRRIVVDPRCCRFVEHQQGHIAQTSAATGSSKTSQSPNILMLP